MQVSASCIVSKKKDEQVMHNMELQDIELHELSEERIRERYRIIGRKLAYFRRLKGYTQMQLAEKIGITANYLSQIECGKREKYSLHTLMLASEALHIPLKDLCD